MPLKCSIFIEMWLCIMKSDVMRHHWDSSILGTFSKARHNYPWDGPP